MSRTNTPKVYPAAPWRCPRCRRWVKDEPIGRSCLRCKFEDHRGADPHCTCNDCILWADGSHPFSPKETP